ncbi:MAG: hypothetical protein ACI8P3_000589 [Saprospiraceae bacterium]|jgi:hypothetical protein
MKVVLCLFFPFLLLTTLVAQDLVITPIGEILCKPGVINKSPGKGFLIEYELNPDIRMRSNNAASLSNPTKVGVNKRFNLKLKAPLINKEKFKMLVGWNYYSEEYKFTYVGQDNASIFNNIDDEHLKSSRISLYAIRPINHKYYVAIKAVASYNGDYDGALSFDERYTRYDFAGIFGVKKRTNLEWGVGLLVRKNFTKSFPLLPFAVYNQTFNAKWGVEITFPTSLQGRYNFNKKSLLLFGPQYQSRSYSIDITDKATNIEAPYLLRRSELRFNVRYDHNIKSWLWLELSTGYVRNFSTRFDVVEKGADVGLTKVTPTNGPFFKFGLFLSPPKYNHK